MQINLLKNVVEDIAGKPAREIVDLLYGKKDVNEFLIAKKLKLTINQTRNILYKLSDAGLVSFTRKKDKRKGWYIYFWTLSTLKSLILLEKNLSEEIRLSENQLKNRKTKRFYYCEICHVEVREETALLNNFTCPECGQVYVLSTQDKIIKELENKISKLSKIIETIRVERKVIEEKIEKRRSRREKAEAKKKAAERKKKREENKKIREAEKRKLEREAGKKGSKKAVKKVNKRERDKVRKIKKIVKKAVKSRKVKKVSKKGKKKEKKARKKR